MKSMLILLILFGSSFQTSIFRYSISVKINRIHSNKGTIIINLYNSSAGFPSDRSRAFQSIKVPAKTPSTESVFYDIASGTYAISVLHDENNNGEMNKNFFGVPQEGYCVSNNAKGVMSAPSFKNATFDLKSNVTQSLNMIY